MEISTHPPITVRQWCADLLRVLAKHIEGATITPPTPQQIRIAKLREAEIALIDADAEAERTQHTAAMLRARVERLGEGRRQ